MHFLDLGLGLKGVTTKVVPVGISLLLMVNGHGLGLAKKGFGH
jgi:hypothetical protein